MSKKIDIISCYLGDYSRKLTGREIARLLGINPQTALNHLNDLVKSKVLLFETVGRNKEYSLNLDNLDTEILVDICENYSSLDIKKEIKIIISDILNYCSSVIMFGSVSSGNYDSDSDLDLIVIGGDKEKLKKISKKYSREINIEYVTYSVFKKSLKSALGIEILRNHKFYGDVSKMVKLLFWWYRK